MTTKNVSKNAFLKSFTNGKLRKNAKKKIAKLLEYADKLILSTQSMGMDDCFRHNDPIDMPKSDFWAWYERNYDDMHTMLTVFDGVLTKIKFCDCPYHFSNDVIMTFILDEETEEPSQLSFTFEQVTEALRQGYISPLNHDRKHPETVATDDVATSRKVVSLGDYQGRIEAKRERLEARAEKAQIESNTRFDTAHALGEAIPFGQPILVGHHSERKHRNHIAKIDTNMRKSVEAQQKADRLETRAQNVGKAGIASDDPDAIQKLKVKLNDLQTAQEMMKSVNKVVRSTHMSDAEKIEYMMNTHDLSEKKATNLLEGDFCGRIGFASYALQNNNATIRATKQRIAELEKLHNEEPLSGSGSMDDINWTLFEDDGRIKFEFDGIPSEEVRTLLKSNGFRWSRYARAWVRKMTANAVNATQRLLTEFN